MTLLRRLIVSLVPLLLLAGPVGASPVEASLVAPSATIQPGKPFWVALSLNHEEHWHSYWINAGTGYPTSLAWKLPPGFAAGPIVWPTPHVVKDTKGVVTGHGYEGQSYLFVQITPPANLPAGQPVTLQATADWLMCKDVCMPGNADVSLRLEVGPDQPAAATANSAAFNQAFGELPPPLQGWSLSAVRTNQTLTVRLTPAAGTTHRPQDLHLFDSAGLVDYSAAQKITEDKGTIVLTLAVASEAPAEANRVSGVLTSTSGWGPAAPGRGVTFDVELGAPAQTSTQVSGLQSQVSATPASTGLAGTLLLAFIGGLILNLMPCVFPVLGIKILGFVNQSGNDRRKITLHGLVFALGVLVSFWTLAGVLLVLRAGGSQLGWGFQLQSPAFVFGMAVFMLIFALNMSGLFEVGLAATGVGSNLQMKEGYSGSFFTGALATMVATPCSAPFLAPALGAALSLSAFESILIFTAIAIGLALPYLLLSIFPQAIKLLPRPGAWMETFKQAMAFPLYGTVGWLLWVLAGQTRDDDNALLLIAFGFVLVAMAAWAYGRFGQAFGKPRRQLFGRVFAALLLAGGLYTGWPKTAAPVTDGSYQVTWEKWSPEAVKAAQDAGRVVYVDFTARWCATCQTNKAAVFHNDGVLAELAKKKVVLLRGDWTNRDPKITAELARWNRSAVPFNLIYSPGKAEPIILPELLTPATVLEALGSTP